MKKQILGAAIIIASGLAAWKAPSLIESMVKDPIDIELNRKACIMASKKSVNDFVITNGYELSDKARRKADLVISQQCKLSVYSENGERAGEPKTLKSAGSMFIDGLDYEESLTVRYAKKRSDFNGKVVAKMGIKEVSKWIENFEDANKK
ncbi:hypothetical protein [Enterobacter phage N5822]|nr:hypothetical protein [Enterobacter phage N5822]